MRRRARFKRIMKGVWSFLKTRELAHSTYPWQVAHLCPQLSVFVHIR